MRYRRPAPAARHGARAPEERSLTAGPRFIGSFPRADAVIDPPLSEVALIGRSNVGKSSLLNALAGQRIAKTSGTPGKTRALNVYLIPRLPRAAGPGSAEPARAADPGAMPRGFYLLDLPGYGYARASQAERRGFRLLITHTLARPRLTGVLWLLDIRHEPSADDRAMHELFAGGGTRVLAALTKSDTLSRSERLRREGALLGTLALDREQVVATSARENEGIDELRDAIAGLVGAR